MAATLSELEVYALAALERLGPEAYGVLIQRDIETRLGRSISIGSLYKALHRLERRGLARSSVGTPTAVRGGRAKKYVEIRPEGREALREATASLRRMVEGLDLGWEG